MSTSADLTAGYQRIAANADFWQRHTDPEDPWRIWLEAAKATRTTTT